MHSPNDQFSTVELPELTPGITLVDVDSDLGVTPIQTLLLDQLLACERDAHWVDAAGTARTTRLRQLAPHPRHLDHVHVARGFTPYQYTSLIDRLGGRLDDTPAVVLSTGVDRLYRDGDLAHDQAEKMFIRAIASLARIARIHDVPVLVTRSAENGFSEPLVNAAATHLRCEKTAFGPRFVDVHGDAETLVYHVGGGLMQTTLAYWRTVLEQRARMHEASTLERATSRAGAF